jgi:hypothetical protein
MRAPFDATQGGRNRVVVAPAPPAAERRVA